MNNYSKFLAIIATIFTISNVNATKNYTATNNASIITGVDFYSFTDLLSSNLVAVNKTQTLRVPDASNYVNIRPYPEGSWSGPVIRIELEKIKDNKIIINATTPNAKSIKLDIQSSGVSVGSGTFIKKPRLKK